MYLGADTISLCPGTHKRDQKQPNPKVALLDSMTETFSKPQNQENPAHFLFSLFLMQVTQASGPV